MGGQCLHRFWIVYYYSLLMRVIWFDFLSFRRVVLLSPAERFPPCSVWSQRETPTDSPRKPAAHVPTDPGDRAYVVVVKKLVLAAFPPAFQGMRTKALVWKAHNDHVVCAAQNHTKQAYKSSVFISISKTTTDAGHVRPVETRFELSSLSRAIWAVVRRNLTK